MSKSLADPFANDPDHWRKRAEEALRDKVGQIELEEAQAELARAAAQLKALERLRKIRK